MALLQLSIRNSYQVGSNVWKVFSAYIHKQTDVAGTILNEVKDASAGDLPVDIENPFEREKPQCILCKYKINVDYKNVRLLTQFISRYTGRVYGRHITGLCEHQQKKVETAIRKSQMVGLMGVYTKHPNFLADPDLYDPAKPFKVL